jgi:Domain of unknown function (4846)
VKEAPPGEEAPPADAMRAPTRDELSRYSWLSADASIRGLEGAFAPPAGFSRVPLAAGSFGEFLRGLPLRAPGTVVKYYNGEVAHEASDPNIAAVAEIDVGARDLQQCADSVIRLHAEWLWSAGRSADIAYKFTSGDLARWSEYAKGERAVISGPKVSWVKSAKADSSRKSFRAYLDLVFSYAGTLSLEKEASKTSREDLAPGDFFIMGGSPGHAVIVLDVAKNSSGEAMALLGEGYLPAQDFHVLSPGEGGPWFSLDDKEGVETPFWKKFPWTSLHRL